MATLRRPETRAKDSDRNAVCQALDSALAEGQLTGEEHRQRVARATSAATLGDLQELLSDLQPAYSPSAPRKGLHLPRWAIASAVAAVVVVLGVVVWSASDRDASPPAKAPPTSATPANTPATTTASTPSGPRLLHSVGGVNGLLDQIRKKFGDTSGYELSVYTDYAELRRPDTDDDRFTARWHYEAGAWTGPGLTPNSAHDAVVDLSAFDVAAVLGVMRGAPETMDLKPTNVLMTYFDVEPANDPTAPQALTVRITVSTSFGTGLIDLDGAGNVKRLKQPF